MESGGGPSDLEGIEGEIGFMRGTRIRYEEGRRQSRFDRKPAGRVERGLPKKILATQTLALAVIVIMMVVRTPRVFGDFVGRPTAEHGEGAMVRAPEQADSQCGETKPKDIPSFPHSTFKLTQVRGRFHHSRDRLGGSFRLKNRLHLISTLWRPFKFMPVESGVVEWV